MSTLNLDFYHSFINITEKKKDCHEDKQVQGASFWVPFWHLRLVICGDGVAGPWFEANAVFLCDADALPQWNSVAEGASA